MRRGDEAPRCTAHSTRFSTRTVYSTNTTQYARAKPPRRRLTPTLASLSPIRLTALIHLPHPRSLLSKFEDLLPTLRRVERLHVQASATVHMRFDDNSLAVCSTEAAWFMQTCAKHARCKPCAKVCHRKTVSPAAAVANHCAAWSPAPLTMQTHRM
jgi:hypothetical protein